MHISRFVLKKIALSAGLAATISTASADEKKSPADESAAAKPAEKVAVSPEAQATFSRHDANKDGKLSLEEFDKAFAEMQRVLKVAPKPVPNDVRPADPCPGCGLG